MVLEVEMLVLKLEMLVLEVEMLVLEIGNVGFGNWKCWF